MVGIEANLTDITFMLDRLLLVARGYESALSLALRAEDAIAIRLAAAKLEKVITASSAAVDSTHGVDPACRSMLSRMLEQATEVAAKLVVRSWRYSPEGRSTFHVDVSLLDPPTLVGLNGNGSVFRDIALQNLHLICCRLSSNLSGALFLQVKMSECDFARSYLSGTLWQEVRAEWSSFQECDFSGAQLGDVVFVDCDFRGARFAGPCDAALAKRTNARFIRCNLAGAIWDCTPREGVHWVNCHGVEPSLQPPVADRLI